MTPEVREAINAIQDPQVRHAVELLDEASVAERVRVEEELRRSNRTKVGAYVLIVLLGIIGFLRMEMIQQENHDENQRALVAECNLAKENRVALTKVISRPRTPFAAPPGSSPDLIRAIAAANAAADQARKDALAIVGNPVKCSANGRKIVSSETTIPPPTVAPLPTLPTTVP